VVDLNKAGDKLQRAGEIMQTAGSLLMGLITIPIVGLVFWGIPGLVIGLIVGALVVGGVRKGRR